jgi:hypothetical protein
VKFISKEKGMKKIINGKVFNTETAVCLGSYDNIGEGATSVTDFNYFLEKLYITKKGQYFLYGKGGAMSKYCTSYGANSWGAGIDIFRLDEDEARRWAEDYLSADEYMKLFETEEA